MKTSLPHIPWSTKVGYSTAEAGLTACELFLRIYLLFFFTEQLRLEPSLSGALISFGILWDAITDPIMGRIYDQGNNKGFPTNYFLIFGGTLLALAFYLLFSPPNFSSQISLVLYLTLIYLTVNTALTVISVPHTAMTTSLIWDRNQRTSLFAFRFASANFGALFAMGYAGWKMSQTELTNSMDFTNIAFVISLFIFSTSLITFMSVRKFHLGSQRTPPKAKFKYSQLTRNKPFLFLFLAYLVISIGAATNSSLAVYYYKYRLLLSKNEINLILIFFVFSMSLSLALWTIASYRYGKLRCLRTGILLLSATTIIMYPFLPAKQFFFPFWGGAIFLGFLVGCVILLDSMLTDVVDYDEITSGNTNPGVYFGVWRFGSKVARAGALGLSGLVLQFLGIGATFQQENNRTFWELALFFGPGVGSLLLIGGLMLFVYKFTDQKQIQVQRIKKSLLASKT